MRQAQWLGRQDPWRCITARSAEGRPRPIADERGDSRQLASVDDTTHTKTHTISHPAVLRCPGLRDGKKSAGAGVLALVVLLGGCGTDAMNAEQKADYCHAHFALAKTAHDSAQIIRGENTTCALILGADLRRAAQPVERPR